MSEHVHDVPQVTWGNTEALLQAVHGVEHLSLEDAQKALGDVQPREANYAAQALRFLGWVDTERHHEQWPLQLNVNGHAAAESAEQRKRDAWDLLANWSPVESLLHGDSAAAIADLMIEGLGEITAKRRLGSVMNWIKNLGTPSDVENMQKGLAADPQRLADLEAGRARNQQRYEDAIEYLGTVMPKIAQQLTEGRLTADDLPSGLDVGITTKARHHHGKFAKAVRKAGGGVCAVTGTHLMLFVSHIKPWNQCASHEKTDPANGILLDERWDRLFAAGHVSFSEDGKVMLSNAVAASEWAARGITGEEALATPPSGKNAEYLAGHREHAFVVAPTPPTVGRRPR